MAIGTTRVYVNVPAPLTMERYLEGLKAGRSFVTTGPMLRFRVADRGPGEVVQSASSGEVPWELDLASAVSFEQVEIVVNGEVVWKGNGLKEPGSATYRGSVRAPAGGWIAARVHGGTTAWPGMDSYPFAHTAPIWLNSVGSREPDAARRAARDLLNWMDVADKRLADGYTGADIPVLKKRFADTRKKLEEVLGQKESR